MPNQRDGYILDGLTYTETAKSRQVVPRYRHRDRVRYMTIRDIVYVPCLLGKIGHEVNQCHNGDDAP